MEDNGLITEFFKGQEPYIKFIVELKEVIHSNDDGTCFASLKKQGDCYLYILSHMPSDKYIGDYIIPFRASVENIEKFNNGCKILAERLQILIDTDDVSLVPEIPPAFGDLTHVPT